MLLRIVPLANSPVIASTPKTAIASWPKIVPASDWLVGSQMARSAAENDDQCAAVTAHNSAARPIVDTTIAASVQPVDRSDRSLVHSAAIMVGTHVILPAVESSPVSSTKVSSSDARSGVSSCSTIWACAASSPI